MIARASYMARTPSDLRGPTLPATPAMSRNTDLLNRAVLEWCKLFADPGEKRHWKKIVTDSAGFHAGLIKHLEMDDSSVSAYIDIIRRCRNKFVAHLASDRDMTLPVLDTAKRAVWFYHGYVVKHEAAAGDLAGLALQLDSKYTISANEARAVFEVAGKKRP